MKLNTKVKSIRNLQLKLLNELKQSLNEYIMDDNLIIIAFDNIINSSGLLLLTINYHLNRSYYTLVLLLEMTCYVNVATFTRYYYNYDMRIIILCYVIGIFGVLTYLVRPYTQTIDYYLEISGRFVAIFVGLGSVYAAKMAPLAILNAAKTPLYDIITEINYLFAHININEALNYFILDIFITLLFFFYIFQMFRFLGESVLKLFFISRKFIAFILSSNF